MSTPILGRGPENRNPLLVLADAANALLEPLRQIANNTRPDATAVLPHTYTVTVAQDPGHGKVWGTFCLACSDSAGQYVYPCAIDPQEPIKPPAFFTIGDVYEPDEHGRLRKYQAPAGS